MYVLSLAGTCCHWIGDVALEEEEQNGRWCEKKRNHVLAKTLKRQSSCEVYLAETLAAVSEDKKKILCS